MWIVNTNNALNFNRKRKKLLRNRQIVLSYKFPFQMKTVVFMEVVLIQLNIRKK